jgi:hypothetical protein
MLTLGIEISRPYAVAFKSSLKESLQYGTCFHFMLAPISANPPSSGPVLSGLLTL